MAANLWSVEFDARDPVALARFWAAALDWEYGEDEGCSSASGGDGSVPRLEFVTAPDVKRSRNWMHFDLCSTSLEDQRATVERLVELGARHIDIGQGPDAEHVVLADPEGNELCVLEPGNSFVDYGSRLGSLTCDGTAPVGYFWRDALGWPLAWDQDDETAVRSPTGGVFLTFGGPPPARDHPKHRLHIDIAPPRDGDLHAEVDRLLALGATRIDNGQGDVSRVGLADPDGNELCVRTPR